MFSGREGASADRFRRTNAFTEQRRSARLSNHTSRFGPAAMSLSTTLVRRTTVALSLVSLWAHAGAAQNSQVSLADASHKFLSPGMQGFEARRKAGIGQFITDSALRAASGSRLSQLLVLHMPGIVIGNGGSYGEFPISSRVCSGISCSTPRCYVRMYIDGMLVFDGTPQQRNAQGVELSTFKPNDLSGIEYYAGPAGLPARFAGMNADCGTLLFWSRDS
jgi:hypothetical protein